MDTPNYVCKHMGSPGRPSLGSMTAPHLDGGSHEGQASWRRWHITKKQRWKCESLENLQHDVKI